MSEREQVLLDYSSNTVPKDYVCYDCETTGIKLWRQYQTFVDHLHLLCLACACKDQNETRTPTEDGRSTYTGEVIYWYRTPDMQDGWWNGYDPKVGAPQGAGIRSERVREDTIGWLVPAVPTVEMDTYWGYTSVPQPGVEWWWRLPYELAAADAGGPADG